MSGTCLADGPEQIARPTMLAECEEGVDFEQREILVVRAYDLLLFEVVAKSQGLGWVLSNELAHPAQTA